MQPVPGTRTPCTGGKDILSGTRKPCTRDQGHPVPGTRTPCTREQGHPVPGTRTPCTRGQGHPIPGTRTSCTKAMTTHRPLIRRILESVYCILTSTKLHYLSYFKESRLHLLFLYIRMLFVENVYCNESQYLSHVVCNICNIEPVCMYNVIYIVIVRKS